LLKGKKGVFDRLSDAAFRIKRTESRRISPDSLFESCSIIDADFVEIGEDSPLDSSYKSNSESIPNSESIDPELLEKLKEYLKTRSQEEISEIFEEIRKILESRASKGEFNNNRRRGTPFNEKVNTRENLKNAFKFCSETASLGMERIINVSKAASQTASSLTACGKKSIRVSSKMLNDKWSDLSPRDRKIISEVVIALIEVGLLRSSSKGKRAAFAVLSSLSRRQTPGKNDLEEFVEGVQGLFKRRL